MAMSETTIYSLLAIIAIKSTKCLEMRDRNAELRTNGSTNNDVTIDEPRLAWATMKLLNCPQQAHTANVAMPLKQCR